MGAAATAWGAASLWTRLDGGASDAVNVGAQWPSSDAVGVGAQGTSDAAGGGAQGASDAPDVVTLGSKIPTGVVISTVDVCAVAC